MWDLPQKDGLCCIGFGSPPGHQLILESLDPGWWGKSCLGPCAASGPGCGTGSFL